MEEFRYQRQRVCPADGKLGVHARVEWVKVRVHRCRGAFCLECGEDWWPKLTVRPMTAAEIQERDRIGSPALADWSLLVFLCRAP